jgi:hypothetical protein
MTPGGPQGRTVGTARLRRTSALILLGMTLAGCSSTLSSLPSELGGLPADAPAKPEGQQLAYPAVHDMPPPRQGTIMTPAEVRRAEAEMAQARDRQSKQPTEPKSR